MPAKSEKHATRPQGVVTLVGAGPGDAGLITVAGLDALRDADVVVYDALANPRLLDQAPPNAERIDAGKRAKAHRLTQDQTNALMRDHAFAGRRVVRLKGGDPYLFGRGAEEVAFLASHGVRVEVVPGVTAGVAAPAAAGIPVTHRNHASSVTFVTGHEDPTKPESSVDYAALARLAVRGGTLCLYMGVGRLGPISQTLIAHGLAADTPAAAVQWGTLPRQRRVRAPLGRLADAVQSSGLGAPAIVIIGAVAAIDEPGLDYFTARPLFGRRVVITRTRQQASALRLPLEARGAEVLEAPTIERVPPETWDEVDRVLRGLERGDVLVLTSTNGVDALADRLSAMSLDARHLAGVTVAVIADATRDRLHERLGIRADVVPPRFVAESLAESLVTNPGVAGRRVVMCRADLARPALPRLLREAGASITDVTAYQTAIASSLPRDVSEAISAGEVDAITFTSSSTAQNLATLLGDEHASLLRRCRLISIGPITSNTMRELGWEVAAEARVSTIDGVVDALLETLGESGIQRQ
mgnify:CR=1 FL=1